MINSPCACICRGCAAFHTSSAARRLDLIDEELALTLLLAVAAGLRNRGIDVAKPEVDDVQAVDRVLGGVTALARHLCELIEDPQDAAMVEQARRSIGKLAVSLTVAVDGPPQQV